LYLGGEKLKRIQSDWYCYILLSLFRIVLIGVFCIVLPARLNAQNAEAAPPPAGLSSERDLVLGEESPGVPVPPQGQVSFFVILRTILVLLLAAVAIYGAIYLLKRIARPKELRDPNLRVLASTHLGQNRFVHVVALGTRAWLVGSSDGGVTHIADIEEQEALDALLLEESRRAGAGPVRLLDFRALMRRFAPSSGRENPDSGKGFGPSAGNSPGNSAADKIRERRERLKGL
jgi:flagellar protein FliO/FliZ